MTSRERGETDAFGYALLHAHAPGTNHHWSIDVSLRAAPVGTYALLFSTQPPADRRWFPISADDPALRCAAAGAKACTVPEHGDVLSIARVGPGGTGVLRGAFDVGAGGWFSVVRIEGPAARAAFDVRLLSEALTKEDEPHRFTIDQVH